MGRYTQKLRDDFKFRLYKDGAAPEEVFSPSFDDVIDRLEHQKNNLVELMDWLSDYIFGNTQVVDFKQKQKPFSANKYNHEVKYSMIVPVQHNEEQE